MKKSLHLGWLWLFISIPFLAFAQPRQVTGTVTDENGTPIGSVSVVQKGTNNGTTTDAQGKYSLQNVPGNAILFFFLGGLQIV